VHREKSVGLKLSETKVEGIKKKIYLLLKITF